ncbi:hypothetical protein SERLA73DRAFT_74797 [Serpula lacrymans var. lacrymans S7.3]|uniref:Uncharacterized protein n=1 Tax=Serpula lacrymans var. lacrymans (strain S7.3) TaxID=936435 RepID=F8Q3K0_SERL3|nr:hypothetical protein SERLA73DRAFT_74797 [Serpula lacrymans var. lacrymans S7.3]
MKHCDCNIYDTTAAPASPLEHGPGETNTRVLDSGKNKNKNNDVHVAGATLTRNALGYCIDCPLAVDNNVSVGYSCRAEIGCMQFPQTLTRTTFRRTVFSAITICNNYPRPLYGLIIRHALPVSDDLHVQVVLCSPKDVANAEGSAMVNSNVQPDAHARWSSNHEHHSGSGLDRQQNKLLEWEKDAAALGGILLEVEGTAHAAEVCYAASHQTLIACRPLILDNLPIHGPTEQEKSTSRFVSESLTHPLRRFEPADRRHSAASEHCAALFSDSTKEAKSRGRRKVVNKSSSSKSDVHTIIAHHIFSVDEHADTCQDYADNPQKYARAVDNHLSNLKTKYQAFNCELGSTGSGLRYDDIEPGTHAWNLIVFLTAFSFRKLKINLPWWEDLHGWWREIPSINILAISSSPGHDHGKEASKIFSRSGRSRDISPNCQPSPAEALTHQPSPAKTPPSLPPPRTDPPPASTCTDPIVPALDQNVLQSMQHLHAALEAHPGYMHSPASTTLQQLLNQIPPPSVTDNSLLDTPSLEEDSEPHSVGSVSRTRGKTSSKRGRKSVHAKALKEANSQLLVLLEGRNVIKHQKLDLKVKVLSDREVEREHKREMQREHYESEQSLAQTRVEEARIKLEMVKIQLAMQRC